MAEEKAGAAQASVREITAGKEAALKKVSEENRFRMLSLARSLAVRSVNHTGEKDLQILLALQSFIFNDSYNFV